MSKRHKHTVNCCMAALFCVIMAVCSWVCIPSPFGVQFTLQTFAVALCGFCLGVKLSSAAVSVYITLGIVGVPVFSSFQAGMGIIAGPTGGFIIGFFALSVLCALGNICKTRFLKISLPFLGLLLCHTLGVLWFSYVTSNNMLQSLLLASVPFILKDVISLLAAKYTAEIIRKRV